MIPLYMKVTKNITAHFSYPPTIYYLHPLYFQFSLSVDSEYLYQLQVEAIKEEEVLPSLQYNQELSLLEAVKEIPCHPDLTVKLTVVKSDM